MYTNQIALISQTPAFPMAEVSKISAAIQKQITRDFTPIWDIKSTIDAFEKLEDVPLGYWPIIIMDDISHEAKGAEGFHRDKNGQPYALVRANRLTPLTCSHECLEMLVDPFGERFIASNSLIEDQGRVNYLVEVCDPCESDTLGYPVNGYILSDFYTPNYFDPVFSSSVKYSFTGAVKAPKQILDGGYLTWMVPETEEWWQGLCDGNRIYFRHLNVLSRENNQSWREKIDSMTNVKAKTPIEASASEIVSKSSSSWARSLKEDIEKIKMMSRNK